MCEVTQGPSFGLELTHNCKVTINWFVVQNLTRETTPQESIRWTVNSIFGDLKLRSEQFCHLQELNQCWFVKFSDTKANTLMRKLFICELLKTDVDWNGIFSVDPKGEWYICTRFVRKLHGKLLKKPRIGRKPCFCEDYDNFVMRYVMNCISSGKMMPWSCSLILIWGQLPCKIFINQRNVADKSNK